MQEGTFDPPSDKVLEAAFKTIEEGHKPLTKDRLEKCLTTQGLCSKLIGETPFECLGEPLTSSEFNEMLNHVVMRKGGVVDWKAYMRDVMYIINKRSNE